MNALQVISVFAPIMPIVVQVWKYFFPEDNPRIVAGVFSAVVGLASGLGILYLGEAAFTAVLAQIGAVSAFIFGIGTGLYKIQK